MFMDSPLLEQWGITILLKVNSYAYSFNISLDSLQIKFNINMHKRLAIRSIVTLK